LERYPWGRSEAIVRGRVGFTLLAQQVVALYRQSAGRNIASYGVTGRIVRRRTGRFRQDWLRRIEQTGRRC